jgi:hypothetical protein
VEEDGARGGLLDGDNAEHGAGVGLAPGLVQPHEGHGASAAAAVRPRRITGRRGRREQRNRGGGQKERGSWNWNPLGGAPRLVVGEDGQAQDDDEARSPIQRRRRKRRRGPGRPRAAGDAAGPAAAGVARRREGRAESTGLGRRKRGK